MVGFLPLFSAIISGIVKIGSKYIDSEEKKKQFEAEVSKELLKSLQLLIQKVAEEERLKAQVIIAETKSDSWLTRSWRPLVVLAFTGLIFLYWFGIVPKNLTPETIDRILLIVQGALWGYIGSRGIEKVAGRIMQTLLLKKSG